MVWSGSYTDRSPASSSLFWCAACVAFGASRSLSLLLLLARPGVGSSSTEGGSLEGGGMARDFPLLGRGLVALRFSLSEEKDAAGETEVVSRSVTRLACCRTEASYFRDRHPRLRAPER